MGLDKPVFLFDEALSGYVYPGNRSFGEKAGEGTGEKCECGMDVSIEIRNMHDFVTITEREAALVGKVHLEGIGKDMEIKKGVFRVFRIEEDGESGRTIKTMEYQALFQSSSGEKYSLYGIKKLYVHSGGFDPLKQMTTLYTTIYYGAEKDEDHVFATGILRFNIVDIFSLVASMRIEGTTKPGIKAEIMTRFIDFFFEEVIEIYLNQKGFCYRTDYRNVVVSGKFNENGTSRSLFMFGGAHDQGFPWGDPQTFSDICLILENAFAGCPEKYVMAATSLPDLKIDIRDTSDGPLPQSSFRWKGKLYRLKEGYRVSFCDDLSDPDHSEILSPVDAEIEVDFTAFVPERENTPIPGIILPFAIPEGLENPFLLFLRSILKKYASSMHPPGIRLGIRPISVERMRIRLDDRVIEPDISKCWGEAEDSTFNFIREPSIDYNYFCTVDPEKKRIAVHVNGDVFFKDVTHYGKQILDHTFSSLMRPFSDMEIRISQKEVRQIEKRPNPIQIRDNDVLEIAFEHFDTGVFQRRVVRVDDASGRTFWALEEDMKHINLKRIPPKKPVRTNSPLDQKRTLVAVFGSRKEWPKKALNPFRDRPGITDNIESLVDANKERIPDAIDPELRISMENDEKRILLQKVVQKTKFIRALEEKARELGKPPSELKIAIKPNFMFLYSKKDPTTYTDPVLLHELIDIMRDEGFTNISVVEAQSTYGEYFRNRDVLSVARYIGIDGNDGKYEVVDLTEDEQIEPEQPFTGPLKGQKVPKTWADADFRISFAKNKTHAYAYFTLTIKCVYGALPLANKFKEYHCTRGIYGSTIEYISHYPVHFGFIDAYVSADGPFGIFADKSPNYTRTIIGGENIVAVDWIGASKMGYNPLVSRFMSEAVERFGKPRIDLAGDLHDEIYHPWINVPVQLSEGLNDELDKHYTFGNIMYSALATMDEEAFPRKNDGFWMKFVRFIDRPFRDMFFVHKSSEKMKRMYETSMFPNPDLNFYKDVNKDK